MTEDNSTDLIVSTDMEEWQRAMNFDAVKEIRKINGEYDAPDLNDQERNLLRQHHANLKTGLFAHTPIKCPGGVECKYATNCPLAEMGKEPIGDPCPIEKEMYMSTVGMYVQQFGIDPIKHYSQYKVILNLAREEVYQKRVIELLGDHEEGSIIKEYVIGIDQSGKPIISEDVNKLFNILDRIDAKIARLQKMLVATPEAEYKREAALKQAKEEEGVAKSLSRIKQNTDHLLQKFRDRKRNNSETIIDIDQTNKD